MSAGLTEKDEMMYVREVPWHRQGVKLDNPATAQEAIESAKLGWNVVRKPVYTFNPDFGGYSYVPNKKAIVREDTDQVFSIMGDGYVPTQNTEAFDLFDSVVAQGEAVYHTAGSLQGGAKVWILAKLPEDIKIIPNDPIQPYILLSNSHDGSSALKMALTPIRVVCANTLTAALRAAGERVFYARHTKNILNRANEARDVLGLANAHFELFAKQIDELVQTRLNATDYFRELFDVPDPDLLDDPKKIDYRKVEACNLAIEAYNNPTNRIGGMQGTAWAAFNAVTYYIDHERRVRGVQSNEMTLKGVREDQDLVTEKRLKASWFGAGVDLRQRAWDLARTAVDESRRVSVSWI